MMALPLWMVIANILFWWLAGLYIGYKMGYEAGEYHRDKEWTALMESGELTWTGEQHE